LCVIGASVSALFATYIGLVPFRFEFTRDTSVLDAFLHRAEFSITSRANFLANALLFVPIGFFGTGAFIRRRTGATFAAALCGLLVGSTALSLSVEVLQTLTPSRTPSMADVAAQVLGATIGILGWLAIRREVHAWAAGVTSSTSIGPLATGLWVYAAFLTLALLLPLDVTVSLSTLVEKYHQGRILIDPRHTLGGEGWLQAGAADIVLNAPIGALAYLVATRLTGRRSFLVAVAIGGAFTTAMELAQVIVVSRSADVADIITGMIGVVAGAMAGAVFLDVHGVREGLRPHRSWASAGALLSLATYAIYNLSPFDFTTPPDLAARVSMFFQIPFSSYYDAPELQALAEAVLKAILGVPVGVFCGLMLGSTLKVYPRAVTPIALLAGAMFFGAIEAGQVLLPSRYPDNTDVVLATCGMWAGLATIRLRTR
jgi:glycopeptide antibiotics resistance protein